MKGVDELLGEADGGFAAFTVEPIAFIDTELGVRKLYLVNTCWVLEGADFEEPEPIVYRKVRAVERVVGRLRASTEEPSHYGYPTRYLFPR